MHTFLMVLLWVFLCLLGLLVLLLIVPVQVAVEYKEGAFTAKLRVLFFLRFGLYPAKEKPQSKKAGQDAEKKEKDAQDEKQKKKKTDFTLESAAELVSTAGWLMRIVFKILRFTDITLCWPVHREDAAETAMAYGKTQAWLGGILGTLQNALTLRFKKLTVFADFTGEMKDRRYFYCKIGAAPFIMVAAALYALVHLKSERVI